MTTPQPQKRDMSNPWGRPPPPSSAASTAGTSPNERGATTKMGIASIMRQQESEKRAEDRARGATVAARDSSESEEERQVRLAIEASLADSSSARPSSSASAVSGGRDADDDDEDVRRAIALSLGESPAAAARAPPAEASSAPAPSPAAAAAVAATSAPATAANDDEEESLKLARALQGAESDADATASLALAMKLQEEENASLRRERAQASLDGNSNVRTVNRSDFLAHRSSSSSASPNADRVERKLLSGDDYENASDDEVDEECGDDGGGFRLNASDGGGAGGWQRRDANTIVSPTGQVRTKHDVHLKNRSNAERLLQSTSAGSDHGEMPGVGVSDRAYNSFRQRTKRSTAKGVATHGTGRAERYDEGTREGALDSNTLRHIQKAINNGLIESVGGVVKEGKEAIVYHATGGTDSVSRTEADLGAWTMATQSNDGFDVAVKVFKRIQEFKGRREYVDGDVRYGRVEFSKASGREQVEIWTEKEYRNLIRANRSGVPCPVPLWQKDNILFMRFLGEEGWPSPQLREIEIRLGSSKWTTFYCQVLIAVRRLYHCARLVHADLSEYNILVCPSYFAPSREGDEGGERDDSLKVVLIDFGQAVEVRHPAAAEFLERDLSMINAFFARKGIAVLSKDVALKFVLDPPPKLEEEAGDEMGEEEEEEEEIATKDAPPLAAGGSKRSIRGWDDERDLDRLRGMLSDLKT